MKTLGIDLAAQPAKTAACALEWTETGVSVTYLNRGENDDALLAHIRSADRIGIDAPFGWPDDFVEAVTAHSLLEPWPGRGLDQPAFRARLAFRETDRHMIDAESRPLSVSTDRIGVTAMRCAYLLDRISEDGMIDRVGRGKLIEVYPAATLRRWGFSATGYKRSAGLEALSRLVSDLERRAPWLAISPVQRELCVMRDDAFDALIAALTARAAALGLTELPAAAAEARAAREGWIHLPQPGSFDRLLCT
jgi:predicted nuclease with RNAse H fold